jgi:hypothetical protein
MPTNVRPMLATLVYQPFDRRGWLSASEFRPIEKDGK